VVPVQANFCNLPDLLEQYEIDPPHAVLLDLGLSSDQLADDSRGFSFNSTGPLDMRFDIERGEPAWRLIARLSEKHLADLIYEFGEERHSRRIARRLVEARIESERRGEPLKSTAEIADLVRRSIPGPRQRIDGATRTFQALRIAVNEELKSLEIALRRYPECMQAGARVAIISFHSLEDRRVKDAFQNDERFDTITRRPVRATEAEIAINPRSRSAKLRVARVVGK
jgi:16S rRNA (cytosine1402-N4)-methyltransferase